MSDDYKPMTEAQAIELYGKYAGQCVCGAWGMDHGHFDGTYFTCDPKADCNQPGYDPENDGNRG